MRAADAFGGRMLILAGVSGALLAIAGAAAVFMAMRSADAERWVAHTIETRRMSQKLMVIVQDLHLHERGFLLTGDDKYATAFEREVAELQSAIVQLRRLTADNALQRERLGQLVPQIDSQLGKLRDVMAIERQGRRAEVLEIVRSDALVTLASAIRAQLDTFTQTELDLLQQRNERAAGLRNALLTLIGVSLAAAAGLAWVLVIATLHYVERLRDRAAELELEISRRRETEANLRQAQKLEAVGQLTGGIAHDFNNLLTIILGNLDTLRRRLQGAAGEASANLTGPLGMAMQGCRSAAQLTHRLLAFSRRQVLEPSRLDINRLVAGMSDMLRRTLSETINVETVLAGGLWPTFADANQLENALLNLTVNARDAMADGGHLTIETANTYLDDAYARRFGDVAPGQYVLLSVTDTGGGIAPEVLERVFEPFFTTKTAEQGSGLGLAMVHGFVKQSGGHIRIYSEVGQGTTVKIYLPRHHGDEAASAPAPKKVSADVPAPSRTAETILVVEDNDGVREYAASILSELGYRVIEAADGPAALGKLGASPGIDLLFTDVVLPGGMSGRDLADKVREMRPTLPILFTTGYTQNAIVHHGRLDPNVNLLGKPYTQQELGLKIRQVLDAPRTG